MFSVENKPTVKALFYTEGAAKRLRHPVKAGAMTLPHAPCWRAIGANVREGFRAQHHM